MRLNDLDKTSIKYYLSEDLKKDSSLNEHWDRIDNEFFKPWQKYLNEATLTPDQINQMFAAAEKETSAGGGGNSTMLGKIVDKIIPDSFLGKLEKALPEPDPKAVPDPEFEAKATAAVNNLEAPAETKTGLMAIVKAALKNPQAQAVVLSLVGGVLGGLMSKAGPLIATFFPGGGTAAVAITGALVAGGVAIAAAKLQGKPWKEAFKGAIKPALAGAAGAVIGQFAAGIAGAAVDKVAGALSSTKPVDAPAGALPGGSIGKGQELQNGEVVASLDGNGRVTIQRPDGTTYTVDRNEAYQMSADAKASGATSRRGDSGFNSMKQTNPDGTPYSVDQINQAKADQRAGNSGNGPEDFSGTATPQQQKAADDAVYQQAKASGATGKTTNYKVYQNADPADPAVRASIDAKQDYYKNDPQGRAEYAKIMGSGRKGIDDSKIPTGKKLSEGQVYFVFNRIVTRNNYLLVEGRLAEGPMDWIKTKAKNLTTKVTADKLNSAWQKAGSPTDSEQLKKFLTDQGVAVEVVDKVYTDMKLPAAGAAADPEAAAALDPKQAETLYAKVKKEIVTLDKKSQKQMVAYLQKQLGTA